MKKLLSLIAAAGLGAGAMTASGFADPKEDGAEKAGPDPRIGEEVNRICFQRNIKGWRPVKGEDDVVLLERGINNWYRVELLGACDERLFRFAHKIGIDSRPGGGCVTRGDAIIVEDSPGFNRRCTITAMYEWDEDALNEVVEEEEMEDIGDDGY